MDSVGNPHQQIILRTEEPAWVLPRGAPASDVFAWGAQYGYWPAELVSNPQAAHYIKSGQSHVVIYNDDVSKVAHGPGEAACLRLESNVLHALGHDRPDLGVQYPALKSILYDRRFGFVGFSMPFVKGVVLGRAMPSLPPAEQEKIAGDLVSFMSRFSAWAEHNHDVKPLILAVERTDSTEGFSMSALNPWMAEAVKREPSLSAFLEASALAVDASRVHATPRIFHGDMHVNNALYNQGCVTVLDFGSIHYTKPFQAVRPMLTYPVPFVLHVFQDMQKIYGAEFDPVQAIAGYIVNQAKPNPDWRPLRVGAPDFEAEFQGWLRHILNIRDVATRIGWLEPTLQPSERTKSINNPVFPAQNQK